MKEYISPRNDGTTTNKNEVNGKKTSINAANKTVTIKFIRLVFISIAIRKKLFLSIFQTLRFVETTSR